MSMIAAIKAKLGLSNTTSNNFILDASAADGTMKLSRESGGDILTVDASGTVSFKGSTMTAVADYVADFQTSGSTTNAGRVLFSQNSTYALAIAPNSTAGTSAYAHIQWIQRSDGAVQSTPLRLNYNGSVLAIAPNGGLGYGTGAGGSVTQLTSKSTAVTLNKPTGQITMNNAALAAGASVYFNLNNSLFSSNDVAVLTGIDWSGNYRIETANSTTGIIGIRVTNITTGSLSEALVINFAIIKGATA